MHLPTYCIPPSVLHVLGSWCQFHDFLSCSKLCPLNSAWEAPLALTLGWLALSTCTGRSSGTLLSEVPCLWNVCSENLWQTIFPGEWMQPNTWQKKNIPVTNFHFFNIYILKFSSENAVLILCLEQELHWEGHKRNGKTQMKSKEWVAHLRKRFFPEVFFGAYKMYMQLQHLN